MCWCRAAPSSPSCSRAGRRRDLLDVLKRNFAKVRHVKPAASRQDSAEVYIVATDFRGSDPRDATQAP